MKCVDWERLSCGVEFLIQRAKEIPETKQSNHARQSPHARVIAPSLLWGPLSAIGAAAFSVEIPFFFFGTPSGHDFEFHLYSWLEVLSQWKQGVWFPRWAAMAHFGYGEPRFVFYPPASWLTGALLSAIVPWRIASAVYIWLALALAGVAMFLLARRWLDRRGAALAAVLYVVNPYHLVIVYWRSAFAELLASCLVPLLLLAVLRLADGKRFAVTVLTFVVAAAWLTNAPAAVMIHYSLALLLLAVAWQERSWRILVGGAVAVAAAASLSAFYLIPAIYEQRWVNIAEAVSAGSRPVDNFLFVHTSDAAHDAFNRIISWVAILEISVALVASWAARGLRSTRPKLWNSLVGWAVACSLMMFSITAPLWRWLPKLEFMQFPWRWLLCLSLIFVLFVTAGLRNWWMRVAVYAVAVLVIATAWVRIQEPWWDNPADLKEMQDNMSDRIGYEGTDEYTPVGAEPSAIDKDAWNVRGQGGAHAAIRVQHWGAELKSFTAEMSGADQLVLKLFSYPAWQVEVNGRPVATSRLETTGQMLIPVAAGMNHVQITFVRTWDRTLGGWISLLSALLLAGSCVFRKYAGLKSLSRIKP